MNISRPVFRFYILQNIYDIMANKQTKKWWKNAIGKYVKYYSQNNDLMIE